MTTDLAKDIRWDLTHLYASSDDLESGMSRTDALATDFETSYRDRVGSLDETGLATALERYAAIQEGMGRAYTYAYLNWVTATHEPARGALLQDVREKFTQTSQKIIFFELEWARVGDERAESLLADVRLQKYRHFLEVQRLYKPHLLSESEEKILVEKSVTGASAWNRYFDETIAAMRFDMRGETVTEQEILSRLYEPDRSVRRDAALAFTEGLRSHSRTLTYIFNTLLADKASNDRLRSYPSWIRSRNLSNEVDDATVDALVSAVTDRFDIVARFYNLKRRLLGLDELTDYDRYAPLDESDATYKWDDARETVIDAYSAFHPEMGRITTRFFDESWIDAAVVDGKRGGAFSHSAVPSVHPYILLNYTGKVRDVQTLAHELGHGVHQYLARDQGVLHADTPLTTAETASVFGEMLVFQRLLERETSDRNKLAMVVSKIDDTIATVFRQVAMNRFEDRIHTERREAGELSADRFAELWMESQNRMFKGSVVPGDHYRLWWSYIPHFLHSPGYVYAYAFGELLVLALYARYTEEPDGFADRYLAMLAAGGSDWPNKIVAKLGVDLTDGDFWARGLDRIDRLVDEAYALAGEE